MGLSGAARTWLTARFTAKELCLDEPMHRHTSLRVGGQADALVVPDTVGGLLELLAWAAAERIPYRILGNGTNLLVSDQGVDGLLISLKRSLNRIRRTGEMGGSARVTVSAGVNLQRLCRFAVKNGLAGMTFAVGIPGTVGGAIRMNAGAAGGEFKDVIERFRVWLPGRGAQWVTVDDRTFAYRRLAWLDTVRPDPPPVILDGRLHLRRQSRSTLEREAAAAWALRKEKQPFGTASAGSFFKNPPSGRTAGELIDLAGLKGASVGGASVSARHANFIVNTGGGTAGDIAALARRIRTQVADRFGVLLEPEVEFIGKWPDETQHL